MNPPDWTLTNPHRQSPACVHGGLVLADPPEAGWHLGTRSNEEATADVELLAGPHHGYACDEA